jgi:glycosyltransferase involved in cell wall biosynthesis
LASGEFIQFLDADDMLLEGALSAQVSMLQGNLPADGRGQSDIVIGGYANFEDAGFRREDPLNYWATLRGLDSRLIAVSWERGLSIPIHCALFRRVLFDDFGFEESLPSKEDWLFWVGILQRSRSVAINRATVAIYRLHGGNMTRSSVARNAYGWLTAIDLGQKRYPDIFNEEVVASAMAHFDEVYWPMLCRQHGAALPWRLAAHLRPGRLVSS